MTPFHSTLIDTPSPTNIGYSITILLSMHTRVFALFAYSIALLLDRTIFIVLLQSLNCKFTVFTLLFVYNILGYVSTYLLLPIKTALLLQNCRSITIVSEVMLNLKYLM